LIRVGEYSGGEVTSTLLFIFFGSVQETTNIALNVQCGNECFKH